MNTHQEIDAVRRSFGSARWRVQHFPLTRAELTAHWFLVGRRKSLLRLSDGLDLACEAASGLALQRKPPAKPTDKAIDTAEKFIEAWICGGTPYRVCPCASVDLYRAYQRWCKQNGKGYPREMNQFLGYIGKLPGWRSGNRARVRIFENRNYNGKPRQQRAVIPPEAMLEEHGSANSEGRHSSQWLTDCFIGFRESLEGGPHG